VALATEGRFSHILPGIRGFSAACTVVFALNTRKKAKARAFYETAGVVKVFVFAFVFSLEQYQDRYTQGLQSSFMLEFSGEVTAT
jgi:hypothetical protein